MNNLTDQEKMQLIFNRIWKGFEKQEWRKSVVTDGSACSYRNYNGDKCAAGQLIDDEFYDAAIEGMRSTNPIVNKAIERSLGFGELSHSVSSFILRCQSRHDNSYITEDLQTSFRALAKKHDLQIPNS